jgi:hypothetical protein
MSSVFFLKKKELPVLLSRLELDGVWFPDTMLKPVPNFGIFGLFIYVLVA